jgi:hypothetical protein
VCTLVTYSADEICLLRNAVVQPPTPVLSRRRALRWLDARRGKGKRGGLRVSYYLLAADEQVWLFTIYDKGEAKGLTAQQCHSLKRAIHDELSVRRGSV